MNIKQYITTKQLNNSSVVRVVFKKISTFFVVLSVVLAVAHNVFPHQHLNENHSDHICATSTHLCEDASEIHVDNCGKHNGLCKKIFEFLSSSVQISHIVQVSSYNVDITPHVCSCKSEYNIANETSPIEGVWKRNLPKRAPPFCV